MLDSLHRDVLECGRTTAYVDGRYGSAAAATPLGLRTQLELCDVRFRYAGTDHDVLQQVSLTVPARATVALVGSTGSGKTTIVDLILGLLRPIDGQLLADGRAIGDENLRAWQRTIGYVPQSIFLTDDSVAANIALGIAPEAIDRVAVERAGRIANLHEFVVSELSAGYDTPVGERGVRLSGGQRQRIGIARALYHDPELLVFDEATSALDGITEQAVMDAVYNLAHKKTIIIITHRLTTVRDCDQIHLLERGRIVAAGTYDELIGTNDVFRAMAAAGSEATKQAQGIGGGEPDIGDAQADDSTLLPAD